MSDYYSNEFGELLWKSTTWYDSKGNQSAGSFSYADGTTYDIVFEYENGRVVKETWYETGTNVVVDYMVNTYNQKGQIIKRDDPPYEIYTLYGYDTQGNVLYSDIRSSDGTPDARWEYTYDKPIKNPSKAIPGLNNYAWWYVNDMFSPTKFWSASLFVNDGAGNYVKLFGEDPSKTQVAVGAQNYATNQFTYDDVTGDLSNEQYWEFENCGGRNVSPARSKQIVTQMDQRSKDVLLLHKPLLAGPNLRKQLADRRAIIQRLKN
jgi:hypothetical protein